MSQGFLYTIPVDGTNIRRDSDSGHHHCVRSREVRLSNRSSEIDRRTSVCLPTDVGPIENVPSNNRHRNGSDP